MRQYRYLCAALVALAAEGTQSGDPLSDLLTQCTTEWASLLQETNNAEARGVPVYLERGTLEITKYFIAVAASDNSSAAQRILRSHYEAYYTKAPVPFADSHAASLPLREANGTLETLQRARRFLAKSGVTRAALPTRVPSTVCDGYYCNADGVPIFGVGFNVWADGQEPSFDPVASGITINTVGFSAAYLQENLTWPSQVLNKVSDTLRRAAAANQTCHILMGQAMPPWAEKRWPGLSTGNFTQHGVNYDIDHPGGVVVTGQAIKAFLDAHGCHPSIGGWILANEPDFTQSGTPHTMDKYRAWLEQEYGVIAALNTAWGSTYGSFDAVMWQPVEPKWNQYMLRGGAASEWWDWNTFNNLRVTGFFEHMVGQIHSWSNGPSNPNCMGTTIKLQNGNEFLGHGGKGINRTALVALQSINGNDAGLAPVGTALGPNGKPFTRPSVTLDIYNRTNYFTDWLDFAAGYMLQKSIDPTKPIYNTEWHGAGTLSWRDEALSPQYIACAVWLGLYHGEAANVAWYFPRDGLWPQQPQKFPSSLTGSFGTEPAAVDTFLREFMTATAHGTVVAAVGRLPPRIWLLRSWSSFALNENATRVLLSSFEVASFAGVPAGFVVEGHFDGIGDSDVVIVPGTTHSRDSTVAWLGSRAASRPGTVVVATDATASTDAVLLYTPHGTERPSQDRAFVAGLPKLVLDTAQAAAARLFAMPAIAALIVDTPARCATSSGTVDAPPFGVLCRFARVAGRVQGLVINLNSESCSVSLVRQSIELGNRFVQRAVDLRSQVETSTPLILAAGAVQLLDLGPEESR